MTDQTTPAPFQQWAIVEIIGRQQLDAGPADESEPDGHGEVEFDE